MKKPFKQIISSLVFLAFAMFLTSPFVYGQAKLHSLKQGESLTLYSDILKQEREMLIYMPDYSGTIGKKIPVCYILDGETHFQYMSGIISYLSSQQLIPPMILVAIKNIDRNKDFSPVLIKNEPASGGADNFHDFIEKELDPWISKKYYTSGYRILMGHSLGGLFASYSMLDHPQFFNAYIAVSPYLQLSDAYIVKRAGEQLPASYNKQKSLYMTLGNEPDYIPTISRFMDILNQQKPKNFKYSFVKMDQYDHGSSPVVAAYDGLMWIFEDWVLQPKDFAQGIASIDAHNNYLVEKYGMDIKTGEQIINLLGYQYLREEAYDKALQTFKENVIRFPDSPNVYDSLGDAYKQSGDMENAKKNYKKAVKLGLKYGSVFIETYQKNLKEAEMKSGNK